MSAFQTAVVTLATITEGGPVRTNGGLTLLSGAAIGAGAMFLLDPDGGGRRRARIRDKMVRATRKTGDAIDATARDLGNRTRGLAAQLKAGADSEAPPDRILEERVRAALGRVCSHPRAVDVTAAEGQVRLTGPILASELDEVLSTVRSVSGVSGVDNQLDAHATPGNIPSLQGGRTRPGRRSALFQDKWSPTTQLFVGLTAGALALALGSAKWNAPRPHTDIA